LPVSLQRTHSTTSGAPAAVPAMDADLEGMLYWRRYPTTNPFAALPLRREGAELAAALPAEPPAGKVEYYLHLKAGAATARVPSNPGETVILRYHGPVPLGVLAPHIAVMFLAMLVGVRAGLGAALGTGEHRSLALWTLAALTLGGLLLGPVTQKYAFGAFWTGVPFGWDLTDNKTLIMWVGWAVAGVSVARRWRAARWLVVLASVVMIAVYLVPHSVRGSQLDYTSIPAATSPR
jgi:hypothetical protein